MRDAGLDEAQVGIKTHGGNINHVRYADATFMEESEEKLISLLMKFKEESEKAGIKLHIQKSKTIGSGPISSVQFSHSVMSESLKPHEAQDVRPHCSSPTPGVYSNLCPLSR